MTYRSIKSQELPRRRARSVLNSIYTIDEPRAERIRTSIVFYHYLKLFTNTYRRSLKFREKLTKKLTMQTSLVLDLLTTNFQFFVLVQSSHCWKVKIKQKVLYRDSSNWLHSLCVLYTIDLN